MFEILIINEAETFENQIEVLEMFKGKQIKSIKLFRDKEKISCTHSSLIVDKIIDLIAPGNSLHVLFCFD